MGTINRNKSENKSDVDMSNKKTIHRILCESAARKLFKVGLSKWNSHKYVAIELVTYGTEIPDVWGTNGVATTIVEVKTSRADFLRDREKSSRKNPLEGMGNFRWYFTLEGIAKEDELPDNWGLIEADESGNIIRVVREATSQESISRGDISTLCSIMRREGVKGQIFDYRKKLT